MVTILSGKNLSSPLLHGGLKVVVSGHNLVPIKPLTCGCTSSLRAVIKWWSQSGAFYSWEMSAFKKEKESFLYGFCEVSIHQAENLPDEDATLGVSCVEKNTSDPAVRITIDDVSLGKEEPFRTSLFLLSGSQLIIWVYVRKTTNIDILPLNHQARLAVPRTHQAPFGTKNSFCFCVTRDRNSVLLFMTSITHQSMKSWENWNFLLIGKALSCKALLGLHGE